jgi:hypothetical protein
MRNRRRLADDFLFQRYRAGAAGWALYAVAELADVDLQLGDGAAERVAVHAQFAGGAALVAFVFFEDGQDETFFEFSDAFRIKNIAAVHLQNECFQLIFHVHLSLCYEFFYGTAAYFGFEAGLPGNFCGA